MYVCPGRRAAGYGMLYIMCLHMQQGAVKEPLYVCLWIYYLMSISNRTGNWMVSYTFGEHTQTALFRLGHVWMYAGESCGKWCIVTITCLINTNIMSCHTMQPHFQSGVKATDRKSMRSSPEYLLAYPLCFLVDYHLTWSWGLVRFLYFLRSLLRTYLRMYVHFGSNPVVIATMTVSAVSVPGFMCIRLMMT